MDGDKRPWDASQLRKYSLTLDEIPRLHYKDPQIDEFIKLSKPVVITESNIVKSALEKWNLEYLERNLGHSGHTVFVSRSHKFKYYDEKKIYNKATNTKGVEFTAPTKKVEMKIEDFMNRIRDWKKGDDRTPGLPTRNGKGNYTNEVKGDQKPEANKGKGDKQSSC